jgi:hypothetical protein
VAWGSFPFSLNLAAIIERMAMILDDLIDELAAEIAAPAGLDPRPDRSARRMPPRRASAGPFSTRGGASPTRIRESFGNRVGS